MCFCCFLRRGPGMLAVCVSKAGEWKAALARYIVGAVRMVRLRAVLTSLGVPGMFHADLSLLRVKPNL